MPNASVAKHLGQQPTLTSTEQGRRRLVTVALNIVKGTALEPKEYERMLLEQFVHGNLTIDQVIQRLEQNAAY